jgi:hypothetical protein
MKKGSFTFLICLFVIGTISCNKDIEGCTDGIACNFNPEANLNDNSCEFPESYLNCDGSCINDTDVDGVCDEFETSGCMDSLACNYIIQATDTDSSCFYAQVYYDCDGLCNNDSDGDLICDELEVVGCTSEDACNFDQGATDDNGSCEFPELHYNCEGSCVNDVDNDGICNELEVLGCLDESACNYNSDATDDSGDCNLPLLYYNCNDECINDSDIDGICDELELFGCTDTQACNYTTETTEDDGSCIYPQPNFNCDGEELVQIGDVNYGGIVFYVDDSGSHGLVCALSNLISEEGYEFLQWMDLNVTGNQYIELNGVTQASIGSGEANTSLIINSQGLGNDAASMCSLASINGYEDWYLPSLEELWEINNHRDLIDSIVIENGGNQFNDGTESGFYWSSSEYSFTDAWAVNFIYIDAWSGDSFQLNRGKPNAYKVRPIRSF